MKLAKAFTYLILGAVGLAVAAVPVFDIALIVMNTFGLIALEWEDILTAVALSSAPFIFGVLAFMIVSAEVFGYGTEAVKRGRF